MNTPNLPEPAHDWAEDLAHDQLVTLTHSHLTAAQRARRPAYREMAARVARAGLAAAA